VVETRQGAMRGSRGRPEQTKKATVYRCGTANATILDDKPN
jgi:hypothetical protein